MTPPRRLRRSATAVVALAGLGTVALATPALAADPEVVNRETVQTLLDASGAVEASRLYSQLSFVGDGTVTVADPTSGKGVRDLDGFDAPPVRDGMAQYEVEVDGQAERRTVADYDAAQPVTVTAAYTLDGEPVEPEDVVGEDGLLEATFTVTNTTSEPTEIRYSDATGPKTETVDLVTPYVGSLALTLPSQFGNVEAEGASVAGDGRGGTSITWSMVLFEPIGLAEQTLVYSSTVRDAELPQVEVKVVPVGSERTELKTGRVNFSGGAATAQQLALAAGVIDANLLNLQAGAGELLDGLTQLADGAATLNAGLADTAAPGAGQLADGLTSAETGAGSLSTGLGTLDAGADTLSAGLSELRRKAAPLAGGTSQLNTGAQSAAQGAADLRDGLARISGGLDTLAAGLPAAQTGLQSVKFGLDHPAGTLSPTDPGGLLQGLTRIAGGLSNPLCSPANPTDPANPCGVLQGLQFLQDPATGLPAARAGVQASIADLDTKLAPGGSLDQLVGGATQVQGGLGSALGLLAGTCPAVALLPDGPSKTALQNGCTSILASATALNGGAAAVAAGVAEVRTSTATSRTGLIGLEAGLGNALTGLAGLQAGVTQLATGAVSARDGVRDTLIPGVDQILTGVTSAVTGITTQLAPGGRTALTGSTALAAGNAQIAAGTASLGGSAGPLLDGIAQLDDGGKKLADGSGTAAAGSVTLSDGLRQLSDGADKLADGLDDAADGSGRIAEGLETAKAGPQRIGDGAGKLSEAGTSMLASAGAATTTDNARKAAQLVAMGEKTADGALPYGAPEGAVGTVAYSYTLAAATSAEQDNTLRGVLALVGLGLAGGVGALLWRRRSA